MTDLILTTLLSNTPDPQRNGKHWIPDAGLVDALAASVPNLTVLADNLPDFSDFGGPENVTWASAEPGGNPYQWRWFVALNYLAALNPAPEFVWMVDATDVIQLRTPAPAPKHLYVGSEPHTLAFEWLGDNHRHRRTRRFLAENPTLPLLNPGIVGGDYSTIIRFLGDLVSCYPRPEDLTDMGMFNDICYTFWKDQIITGPLVHTGFKQYADNGTAWWQHK